MKRFKKGMALLFILCMALVAAGCAAATPQQRIEKARAAVEKMDSATVDIGARMDMAYGDESIAMDIKIGVQYIKSPLQMKMDVNMQDMGQETLTVYARGQDGQITAYTQNGGQWVSQTMPLETFNEQLQPYSVAQDSMKTYLDIGSNFTESGIRKNQRCGCGQDYGGDSR